MDILGDTIARPECMLILSLDIAKWIQMSPNSICEYFFLCVCMYMCAPSYTYLGSRD